MRDDLVDERRQSAGGDVRDQDVAVGGVRLHVAHVARDAAIDEPLAAPLQAFRWSLLDAALSAAARPPDRSRAR